MSLGSLDERAAYRFAHVKAEVLSRAAEGPKGWRLEYFLYFLKRAKTCFSHGELYGYVLDQYCNTQLSAKGRSCATRLLETSPDGV